MASPISLGDSVVRRRHQAIVGWCSPPKQIHKLPLQAREFVFTDHYLRCAFAHALRSNDLSKLRQSMQLFAMGEPE